MEEDEESSGRRDEPWNLAFNYGHFGQLWYNHKKQKWVRARDIPCARGLDLVNVHYKIQSSYPHDDSRLAHDTWIIRERQLPHALKSNPDLAASYHVASEETAFFTSLANQLNAYDQVYGDLLVYGGVTVRNPDRKSFPRFHQSVNDYIYPFHPLLATVDGDSSVLRFTVLGERLHRGHVDDESYRLSVPTLARTRVGTWSSSTSLPIEGLTVSAPLTNLGDCLIAVRQASGITILRPFVYDASKVLDRPHALHRPTKPSGVYPNPLLEIPRELSADHMYLDVAFNPKNLKQIAIVDDRNRWSVYSCQLHLKVLSLQHRLEKGLDSPFTLIASGQCLDDPTAETPEALEQKKAQRTVEAGWARVLFVASGRALLVCTRKDATLFDVSTNLQKRSVSGKVLVLGGSNWILDVRTENTRPDDVFFVTSTQVVLLRFRECAADEESKMVPVTATLIASWTHFRDPEDVSLRCNALSFSKETVILLYSSFNAVVQSFSFLNNTSDEGDGKCNADPQQLRLSNTTSSFEPTEPRRRTRLRGLHLCPAFFQKGANKGHMADKNVVGQLARMPNDLCLHFATLFTLSHEFSIEEQIYRCTGNLDHNPKGELDQVVERFDVADIAPRFLEPFFSRNRRISEKHWIVPEGVDDNDELESADGIEPQAKAEEQIQAISGSGKPSSMGTFAFAKAYQYIIAESKEPTSTFEELLDELHTKLEDRSQDETRRLSVLSDYYTQTKLSDINAASEALQQLFTQHDDPHPLLQRLNIPQFRSLFMTPRTDSTLSDIYDSLIKTYVSNLPHGVHGRTRLSFERRARALALRMWLASTYSLPPGAAPNMPSSHGGEEQAASQASVGHPMTLPVRPSQIQSQSQSLTTATQLSQPSQATFDPPSTQTPQTPDLEGEMQSTPSTRLSHYVSFSKPLAVPTRAERYILAHWDMSTPAREYSYVAATARLTAGEKRRTKGTESKSKSKSKDKPARTQMQTMSVTQPESSSQGVSQPPRDSHSIGMSAGQRASQPFPPVVQPSTAPMMATASQPVPGRHGQGGRQPPKKKARRAGF